MHSDNSKTVFSSKTLTGSLVSSGQIACGDTPYHTFIVTYTPDSASAGVDLNYQIEFSHDDYTTTEANSTWSPYRFQDPGTTTISPSSPVFEIESDDTNSETSNVIDLRARAQKFRIRVKETGSPTFGTVTITWFGWSD